MSKGKNNKFTNRAAKRFSDIAKVDTLSQAEIFEILEGDIKIILDQVTAYREHKPGAAYPQYVGNAFANISTALFFHDYVCEHVKIKKKQKIKSDLDEADLESLRTIISDAFRKSMSGVYQNQQEYVERNELLGKAFKKLYPRVYHLTGKFKDLQKSQRRDLTIWFYGDPVYNFRSIHKPINKSTISDKKKLKLLQKIYGKKRFVRAVGAAMTVEGNNSDCLAMLFDFMARKKKKKRAKYLLAYAEAYKRSKGTRYFRIDMDFYEKNKRLIKELTIVDLGFKKAFKDLRGGKAAAKEVKPFKSGKK